MVRKLVLRHGENDETSVMPGAPMEREAARRFLDEAFVEFGCEPMRSSGKILSVDKVVSVAQAAGRTQWEDPAWSAAFAAAALAALGRDDDAVTIDLAEGRLK